MWVRPPLNQPGQRSHWQLLLAAFTFGLRLLVSFWPYKRRVHSSILRQSSPTNYLRALVSYWCFHCGSIELTLLYTAVFCDNCNLWYSDHCFGMVLSADESVKEVCMYSILHRLSEPKVLHQGPVLPSNGSWQWLCTWALSPGIFPENMDRPFRTHLR